MNFRSLVMGCVISQLGYIFSQIIPNVQTLLICSQPQTWWILNRPWHQHLGHIHQKNMILMLKHDIVIGLPKIEPSRPIYEACILGKQTKKKAPHQNFHRSKTSLEIIHSDVCGPLFQLSLIEGRYILTFTNDCLHYG